ncbi:MAG: ribose-5-phosphate isomerase RpiA [Acidobacteriota bacterium]
MERAKEAAGRMAADGVENGWKIGLGTGSTVQFTLVRLAERISGEGLGILGVPTSRRTAEEARRLGIPLSRLNDLDGLDVTIDGADEVDPAFNLIKGGGGAFLEEKVVAAASNALWIVVDRGKLVDRLGTGFRLPVEVVPLARSSVVRSLVVLGAEPEPRKNSHGEDYRTDHGNEILDCRFPGGIADPAALEREIARIPGVMESGLFIGLAQRLLIGDPDGKVEIRERPGR